VAKPTVCVATLTLGTVRVQQRDYLLRLAQDPRYTVIGISSGAKPVTNNRCKVWRHFRNTPDLDYLVMMDEDVVPKGNVLDYIAPDRHIICFPCPIWKGDEGGWPICWNFRLRDENGNIVKDAVVMPPGELLEASDAGTGCMLFSRQVAMEPALRDGFYEVVDEDGVTTLGHDLAFTERARELGYKIWVALDCPCSHYHVVDLLELERRKGHIGHQTGPGVRAAEGAGPHRDRQAAGGPPGPAVGPGQPEPGTAYWG